MVLDNLNPTFLGNPLQKWIYAAILSSGLTIILLLLKRFFKNLAKHEKETAGELNFRRIITGLLGDISPVIIIVLSAYFGSLFLEISTSVQAVIRIVIIFSAAIQAGIWINTLLAAAIEQRVSHEMKSDPARATTIKTFGVIGQFIIWVIIFLFAIDNISGIKLNALIASLGVGGIAVGFAIKSILDDLFASLSITLDKPFIIGDFIKVGEYSGRVEHIGLKTTRLHAPTGEEIIFGNADILSNRIRNYHNLQERTGQLILGVHPDTDIHKLKRIPAMVEDIVNAQKKSRFNRIHLKDLGKYTLDYELIYKTSDATYSEYLEDRQEIILGILDRFQKEGIVMPFPIQHIVLENQEQNPP